MTHPPESSIVRYIVEHEEGGGWSRDPHDRGGETRFGITATLAESEGVRLEDLNEHSAEQLLLDVFWYRPRIGDLPGPEALRAAVFDQAVNSGPHVAIDLLQRALDEAGAHVTDDGVIGSATIAAVRAHQVGLPAIYGHARIRRYVSIAKAHPDQRRYVVTEDGNKGGWIRRAEHWMPADARLDADDWNAVLKELRWPS